MPLILISGGTGLIGKNLTANLISKGYEVIILSRKPVSPEKNKQVSYALWNIDKQEIDISAISKADFIVHLAGVGVMDKRWTSKYKTQIVESRVNSSHLIIKALQENVNKVKAVISMSAIGWYGKDPLPTMQNWDGFKETDKPDKGFLGETCRLWEESIEPAAAMGKRLIKLRLGIVLSNEGGAFAEFKKPVQFGIAGILGNGKQIISWIHIQDVCRMIIYGIENENLAGSYNAVAPLPVTNYQLIIKTANLLRKSFYVPMYVPEFLLKLILGERSVEILKSTTVSSGKIKAAGFSFLYPSIDASLKELLNK